MRIYAKQYDEDTKCPGCGWRVSILYSFGKDDHAEIGLCANCFMDMLSTENYTIEKVGGE